MGRKKRGIGVVNVTPFEKELLKVLRGIKDELRELNGKVMKPPEPMRLSDEPLSLEEIQGVMRSKAVSIDDLNATINK